MSSLSFPPCEKSRWQTVSRSTFCQGSKERMLLTSKEKPSSSGGVVQGVARGESHGRTLVEARGALEGSDGVRVGSPRQAVGSAFSNDGRLVRKEQIDEHYDSFRV